ncbi:hypothetical protein BDZ97DRAFT_485093 [Flammula alnicola]|nr:hypothetical protein BDZ97DRAFT_485093 [Flammula alnicola]
MFLNVAQENVTFQISAWKKDICNRMMFKARSPTWYSFRTAPVPTSLKASCSVSIWINLAVRVRSLYYPCIRAMRQCQFIAGIEKRVDAGYCASFSVYNSSPKEPSAFLSSLELNEKVRLNYAPYDCISDLQIALLGSIL